MQPNDRDAAYLWDIRDAAQDILRFTEGRSRQELTSDRQFRLAVERAIEIMGEATRRLSVDREPRIPIFPVPK